MPLHLLWSFKGVLVYNTNLAQNNLEHLYMLMLLIICTICYNDLIVCPHMFSGKPKDNISETFWATDVVIIVSQSYGKGID